MSNRYVFSSLIYMLYFISAFLGPNLYLVRPQLQTIRLLPLFLIPYLLCKYIARNQRESINIYFILFTITAYYFYHLAISLLHIELINTNSIINFTVLYLLLLITFVIYKIDWKTAIDSFAIISTTFYAVCILLALYEVNTGNHLPFSAANHYPEWSRYVPTTFYHNTNDFTTIHVLLSIFIYTYAVIYDHKKLLLFLILLFPVSIYLYLEANSRTALLCVSIFLVLSLNFKDKLKLLFISLLCVTIISYYAVNVHDKIVHKSVKFLNLQLNFSDNSTKSRLYLYKQATKSVIDSYGLGYGVDASSRYFKNVLGKSVQGTANPHSYIFELLINGGLLAIIGYIVFMIYLIKSLADNYRYKYLLYLVIYNILLFSSSSSLFLWPHYIVSIAVWFIYLNASSAPIARRMNALNAPYDSPSPQ